MEAVTVDRLAKYIYRDGHFIYRGGHECLPRNINLWRRSQNNHPLKSIYGGPPQKMEAIFRARLRKYTLRPGRRPVSNASIGFLYIQHFGFHHSKSISHPLSLSCLTAAPNALRTRRPPYQKPHSTPSSSLTLLSLSLSSPSIASSCGTQGSPHQRRWRLGQRPRVDPTACARDRASVHLFKLKAVLSFSISPSFSLPHSLFPQGERWSARLQWVLLTPHRRSLLQKIFCEAF
jgi:hypothetical protein